MKINVTLYFMSRVQLRKLNLSVCKPFVVFIVILEKLKFESQQKQQAKECSSKFRSKHSSNAVLCLLRNLLEQCLFIN